MSEYQDIVIYTTAKKLDPKIGRITNDVIVAFWTLGAFPKHFSNAQEDRCRVYFAFKGRVRGYFKAEEAGFYAGKDIPEPSVKFNPWSWKELEYDQRLECKPFQGFKYKWWKHG
jgi:hypothetical protein